MVMRYLLVLAVVLLFLPSIASSDAPNVTLVSPNNENISVSNNVTFICNVTDSENVYNISLFSDINGTFDLYDTKNIMELEKDPNTMLLCRFENTYICEDGEAGTNISTDFVSSKFMKGVMVNDSDTLVYPTSGNIMYNKGTVEFWFKLGFEPNVTDAWLFSTGSSDQNEIQIHVNDNNLSFKYYDGGSITKANKNVSAWNENEWHHVAAIWDVYNYVGSGEILDIFLDGSNESVIYETDYYGYNNFGSSMYLGSYADGTKQANSTFDELRISDRARIPDEINASYIKGAGNHTSESANWTFTNVADGIYTWNCLAYDNGYSSSWNDTNFTLYVDTSPPALNTLTFSPNSTNELDPEVTVNFTVNVTDLVNISFVILQWKETGEWINDTMDYNNSTGLYENASITFDQTGGIYYYRIWSNDTLGHLNYSITKNVTAEWDYTWTRNPSDFGTVYGLVGCSNCYVGMLIINNSGDDTLSFTMTDDWPLSIYYNVSNPFSLGPKNMSYINVTSEFSNEESEYDITINITASHGSETPSPVSQTVTTTLNSYSGGPYFDSDDVVFSYPTSVYQGMGYNLSVKLKNIGNESATGVWINWTLPTGWTNTSGNLTKYINDLNGTAEGGNIAWNNITVYITPSSATSGVQNVYVNANSSENLTADSSVAIYVLCNDGDGVCGAGCSYVTDDDCSQPSGTTGSISVYPVSEKNYDIELVIPSRLDVSRGEIKKTEIGIRNPLKNTELNNVYLSFSGYPQTLITVTPAYLTGIGYSETKYFQAEIKAPVYTVYEEYDLNITAKGEFTDAGETVNAEKKAKILLVTHKSVGNETLGYFEKAEEALEKMNNSGFETSQISKILGEIEKAADEGNYDRVKELSEEAVGIKDLALELNGQIQEMENGIEGVKGYNFNLPETEKMLSLAKSAFQRGDYGRAEERMNNALLMYNIEIVNASFWILIYNYWWLILPVLIVSGIVLAKIRRRMIINSIKKGLDSLVEDEKIIMKLIIKLQEEHFLERRMGTGEYQNMMENYERYIAGMGEKRVEMVSKLVGMLRSSNAMKKLKEEERRVESKIKELQKDYFDLGKIGKRYYDNLIGSFKNEMIEIRKMIDMGESGGNV